MRVVVIIPCYNVEDYVGDAIRSALEQTYPVSEIVAVDNDSSDGTIAVLADFQKRYPTRFRWLHEHRQGGSIARNTGWRATQADWYQFLDADDILYADKIERQLALARSRRAQWVIGTPCYQHLNGTRKPLFPWKDPWLGLAHGMFAGQTSANLYTHDALEQIRGWNENLPYTQDVDLAFRLLKDERRFVLDEVPACLVRDRPKGKLSQRDPQGILVQHLHLRHEMNQFLIQAKVSYWKEHRTFFLLAMYRYARMLACHNPALADELLRKHLPPDFRLKSNVPLQLPAWDAVGVNLFGLARFASVKNRLKTSMPRQWWTTLKRFLSGIK